MPKKYAKSKKSRNDLRKRKSYAARFRDKKINTAIEKKIKAIARREDNKLIQWYYRPKLIVNYNAAPWSNASQPDSWPQINGIPLPQHMAQLGSEANPYALNLTEIGGNLISQNEDQKNMRSVDYYVKRVEAHITLRNQTNITKKVAISIISMANVQPGTASSPLIFNADNIYQNVGNLNNKFAGMFKVLKHDRTVAGAVGDKSSKQVTLLASKVVTLPPSGPSNGGRINNSNAQESTAYFEKDVHLSKSYKVGKIFRYQQPAGDNLIVQPCTNANIFLCICSNGADGDTTGVVGYGVAGIKYRVKGPNARSANTNNDFYPNNE